ncbi:MAG: DUF4282 domain-containing protein [Chromatiales bacterium]|nr:DUF4282 domain-containing protein [Chromatiales bacterium]
MGAIWDFLAFERFAAPHVLFLLYYLGVFALPALVWQAMQRLPASSRLAMRYLFDGFRGLAQRRTRKRFWLIFGGLVLMLELAWRVMFEFFIAYFGIHEFLRILASQGVNSG